MGYISYLYDFNVVASEHLGEGFKSTQFDQLEYLGRTATGRQISDGPSRLLFGFEIANF